MVTQLLKEGGGGGTEMCANELAFNLPQVVVDTITLGELDFDSTLSSLSPDYYVNGMRPEYSRLKVKKEPQLCGHSVQLFPLTLPLLTGRLRDHLVQLHTYPASSLRHRSILHLERLRSSGCSWTARSVESGDILVTPSASERG